MIDSDGGFYGKYRGTVSDNKDPYEQGRIKVKVPGVLVDLDDIWALPCVPYAGPNVGFFAIPPVGANVWVEFESGLPGHPIWTGCFWNRGDVPASPAVAEVLVLKTPSATLTLSDQKGKRGITIEFDGGVKLVLSEKGIEFDNGKRAKIGLKDGTVSVNDGALEVT